MHRNFIGFELNTDYIEMFNNYHSKTFSKSRKEYDLTEKLSNQEEFKNRILELRALKYARLLVTEIDKLDFEYFKIYVQIKGESNFKNKLIKVDYTIIGNINDEQKLKEKLHELTLKTPLSKFGIEPFFKFSQNKKFNDKRDYGYTKSNSYSYQNNVDLDSLKIRVISNICVDLNENDYL